MDDLKYIARRRNLVQELAEKGIIAEKVLQAIGKVPRHRFFDKTLIDFAYEDKAFPIGSDQTISQPYTVAYQSELLDVKEGEKVLEIGTGSGYQSAVLVELGANVYSIERQEALFHRTFSRLPEIGYHIAQFLGDGYKGLPNYAPFDKIIVTASADIMPQALREQLAIGGILVIPISTTMYKITRLDNDTYKEEKVNSCAFVPMIHGTN